MAEHQKLSSVVETPSGAFDTSDDVRNLGADNTTPHEVSSSPPDGEGLADGSDALTQLRAQLVKSTRGGIELKANVYTESGVLLLAAGSKLTKNFLDLLRDRGITKVTFRPPPTKTAPSDTIIVSGEPIPAEPIDTPTDDDSIEMDGASSGIAVSEEELHTVLSRALDERLAGELAKPVTFHPVRGWRRPRLGMDDFKGQATQGVEKHEATTLAVADVCDSVLSGQKVSSDQLRLAVGHFVNMAAIDFDLLPTIFALKEANDEYLYDHCVNVALLSMAMATHLGLDRETVTTVGIGGMLSDIGMLRVPEDIRLGNRALTKEEWGEIHRHPLHTLDMLSDIRGIPQVVRFIAYQTHERSDGSGYPRRKPSDGVHKLAKIVSIADTYAAMTRERPHRPALMPYLAAKTILLDGSLRKFDSDVVRAFLDTISLFPIGSYVELSSGNLARVVRANPGVQTRPVIELLGEDNVPTGLMVDLRQDTSLTVIKAL